MAAENNTNLREKTKLDKNWCSANSRDQMSREWTVKSTRAEWIYAGSNDVLYWYYNSQQESKGKSGIYLRSFDIFTFLAPLWQYLF